MKPEPFSHSQLRVQPLAERHSLLRVDDILIDPESPSADLPAARTAAAAISRARSRGAGVMLIYGAHLIRNGAAPILTALMENGWITHLATNGAGAIHDWEFSFLGRSCERVEENVRNGTFGAWEETGRNLHLALLAGGINGDGFGASVGRFILNDGAELPSLESLRENLGRLDHGLTPIAHLHDAMVTHGLAVGRHVVEHRWKHASILAQAARLSVPATVHPGIGYDIIACHPFFNGAAIGHAAQIDFTRFCQSVDTLDGGVILSIGSAIMGPQVFEKALSCVHNVRLQHGRPLVRDHSIFVCDLQDGGGWDWTQGEPPAKSAAYYLRFCKSFSRMGGEMHYVQADNAAFIHALYQALKSGPP